ncbi:TonB-dependent receptor [candidate division TA06 bacterium]|nr:TonB-dependent receptor [candidate division TA06 bacterium]
MKRHKIPAYLIFPFLLATSTFGQEEVKRDSLPYLPVPPLDLPATEILVTPTRTSEVSVTIPARFTLITKEEILEMGAQDLGEVLSRIPGANVGRFGYLGQPQTLFLQGSSSEGVLFLLDGVPINDIQTGGLDLTFIPLNWIERIEVLKEGASSLYGANAVGGVVNIITKSFKGGRSYSRVALGRGSFETSRTEFEFGRGIGKKNRIYLTGDFLNTDGFQNEEYKLRAGSGKWAIDPLNGWKVTLSGNYFKGEREIYPDDTLDVRRSVLRLHLQKDDSDLSLSYRDEWQRNKKGEDQNRILGAESLLRLPSLLVGLEGGAKWGKGEEMVEGGIFLESEREIFPLLRIIPMLRGDANSVYGAEISPKLSLGYTASLDFHLFASVGQSFRAPTFEELFGAGGDSTLNPEKTFSSNLGAQYRYEGWNFGFSLFRNETKEGMGSNPKVLVRGLEGEIETGILKPFNLIGYGTFLHTEEQESKAELPYRPQLQGGGSVQYRDDFFRGKLEIRLLLDGEYVGERVSEPPVETLEAYHLLHTRGEIRITDFQIYARVSNILDVNYLSRGKLPLPGRTLHLGLSWAFWE